MPKKMEQRNMFRTQSTNANAQWLRNAAKSLGMSGLEVVKDISPNIYDVTENTTKAAQNVFSTIRKSSSRQKALTKLIDNNQYIKLARKGLKNIGDDLKTGNFNNTEREERALLSGEEDTSTSTYFGDDGAESNAPNVSVSVPGLASVSDSIRYQTQSQVKMAEATINSIVAVSANSMLQNQQLGEQIMEHLSNINKGIQSLVAYQNENMTKFIQSSITYYDAMGKYMQPAGSASPEGSDKYNIFRNRNDGGGINTSSYKELVKKQWQDAFSTTQVGQFHAAIKMSGESIVANPLGFITKELMSRATPADLKTAISSIDKTLADFVPEMLSQLYDKWGKNIGTGRMDGIKRLIGKTFGLNTERRSIFDTSKKVTADPVPFDGITRNAISEVIPKYLREQTSYLKEITELLGGNTKNAINSSEMFDIESGTYKTFQQMQKEMMSRIENEIKSTFNMTEFGEVLSSSVSKFTNDKDKEKYDELLTKLFTKLESMDSSSIDLSQRDQKDSLMTYLKETSGASDNMLTALSAAIDNTYKLDANGADRGGLGLSSAALRARLARNRKIEELSNNAYGNGLYSLQGLSNPDGTAQSIDEQMASVLYGTSSALSSDDKRKGSLIDKLDNIQFLLNRGINVKVLGEGEGFGDYLGNGNTPSTSSSQSQNNTQSATVSNPNDGRSVDDMSPEEIEAMMNSDNSDNSNESGNTDNSRRARFGRFARNKSRHINTAMNMFAHGKFDMGMQELTSLFGDGVKDVITNTKNALFGEKDSDDKFKGGLFSNAINDIRERGSSITQDIVGQLRRSIFGYTDEDGNKHSAKGVIGFATDALKRGFEGWKDVIFGKDTDMEDAKKKIQDSIKERSDKMMKGAMVGGGLGIAAGGILGSLIGGPITGALMGTAAGYLSGNKKFQKLLFGDEYEEIVTDEEGNQTTVMKRTGGLISQKTQEFFKKNKTAALGGAALGGLKGAVFGGGLLGNLVGGPIAGALMGTAVSLVAQSDTFKNFIFGKETDELDENGKKKRIGGILGSFSKAFGKITKNSEDVDPEQIKKKVGMAGIGTGAGLLASFFTPLGPIGGAALGLAGSMLAGKERFKNFLFGKEDENEPGLAKRLGNVMTAEVLVPIKNSMKNWLEDMRDTAIEKVMYPIELAMGPIANMTKRVYEKTLGKIVDKISVIGDIIKEKVENATEIIRKAAINVITKPFKLFGNALKGLFGVGAKMLGGAVTKVGNFAEKRNRKASAKRFDKETNIKDENGNVISTREGLIAQWEREAREKGIDPDEYIQEQKETFFYNNKDRAEKLRTHRSETARRREERDKRRAEAAELETRDQLVSRLTKGKFDGSTKEGRSAALEAFKKSSAFKNNKKYRGVNSEDVIRILSDADGRTVTNEVLVDIENEQAQTQSEINTKLGTVIDKMFGTKDSLAGTLSGISDKIDKWMEYRKNRKDTLRNAREMDELDRLDLMQNSAATDSFMRNLEESGMSLDEYTQTYGRQLDPSVFTRIKRAVKSDISNARSVQWAGKVKQDIQTIRHLDQLRKQERATRNALFNITGGRGYALGTSSARPGLAVVGENGPEVVRFGGNESVSSNAKPLNVIIQDVSTEAKGKLNPDDATEVKIVGSSGLLPIVQAGSMNKFTDHLNEASRDIERTGLVSPARMKSDYLDTDELGEGSEEKKESLLDKVKDFFSGTSIVDLIKNIALLGGAATLLYNLFKNGGISNLVDSLKNAADHLAENAKFGDESRENGKTMADATEDVKEDVSDLVHGDVNGFLFNDDHEVDHTTGAKAKFLTKMAGKLIGKKSVKTALNKISEKSLTTALKTGAKNGASKTFMNVNAAALKKVAGKDTAAKVASNIMNGADDSGMLGKIWKWVKKGLGFITEKAGKLFKKAAPKFSKTLTKFFDDILLKLSKPAGAVKKLVSKGIAKIASFLGINTGVAATGVGAIGILAKDGVGIVLGALANASNSDVARLFRCDESIVDGKMRGIAMCLGAAYGTTPGTVIDMVFELATQITGVDMSSELATLVYDALSSDDEYNALKESQDAQKEEYNQYKEESIQASYEQYLIDNGLSIDELSYEDYQALLESGDATAEYDSYADWNDKKHEGVLGKAGRAITNAGSKAWNGIKTGAGKVGSLVKNGAATVKKGISAIKQGPRAIATMAQDTAKKAFTVVTDKLKDTKAGKIINNLVTNIGPTILSYIKGESDAIEFDVSDDNPAKPMINMVGKALQLTCMGPRLITMAGSKILTELKEKFTFVKNFATDVFTQSLAYRKGDIDEISLADGLDNPIVDVANKVVQVVSTPERLIRSAFGKLVTDMKEKFTFVKNFATDVFTQSLAYRKGDIDEISLAGSDDNPVMSITSKVVQAVSTPERLLRSAFGKIKDDIAEKINFVKNFGKTVVTKVEDYTSGKTDHIILAEGDELVSPMIDFIGGLTEFLVTPLRMFNVITAKAKKTMDDAKAAFSGFFQWLSGDESGSGNNGGNGGYGETKNGVPYYSQKDARWRGVPYETGRGDTIGNAGCGPAAFAMAASKETGREIDPVQASNVMKAVGARDNTGTNWSGIGKAANAYGLRSTMSRNPSGKFIDSQLANGHPVVLSGRSGGYGNTPYTKAGHYVVATGIDKNGNYEISDPNGRSKSHAYDRNAILSETGAAWSFGGRGLMPQFDIGANNTSTSGTSSVSLPSLEQLSSQTTSGGNSFTGIGNTFASAPSWTSTGQIAANTANEITSNPALAQVGAQSNIDAVSGSEVSDRERWLGIVKAVKSAIAAQSPGYNQSNYITINVGGVDKSVRTDCSGFVTVCLKYYGVLDDGANLTSSQFATSSNSALQSANFTHSAWNGWESLSPGDIIARNGHVEIFAGNDGGHKVYNCGSDSSVNNAGATGSAKSSYTDVWSPGPAGANAVTGTAGGGATVSGDGSSSTSSSGGFWSKLGSFFTEFGSRAITGLTTGKWNTDWSDWLSNNGSSSSSSGGTTSSGTVNGNGTCVPAANIDGSENAEKAFNFLVGRGYTPAGAAGLLGNLHAESGIKPNNLQDSGNRSTGMSDDQYTAAVDSGSYGNFVNDSIGYGLAQWTFSSRKQKLLDYAKANGTSIGDLGMQLSYLDDEMKSNYKSVYDVLTTTNDLQQASNAVLHDFEAPKDQSAAVEAQRASFGQGYYGKYASQSTVGNSAYIPGTSQLKPGATTGGYGGYGDASIGDEYNRMIIEQPDNDEDLLSGGGFGIEDGNISNLSQNTTTSASSLIRASSAAPKVNDANEYWNKAIQLLTQVTELLGTANGSLENISGGIGGISGGNTNINNIDNRRITTNANSIPSSAPKVSNRGLVTASKIAKGGI